MNNEDSHNCAHQMATGFRDALNECDISSQSDCYHPAEDVVFMERFIAGLVTGQELEQYYDHLSRCRLCRSLVAMYSRNNVLEPVSDDVSSHDRPLRTERIWCTGSRWPVIAACSVAVCSIAVLVTVSTVGLLQPGVCRTPAMEHLIALQNTCDEPTMFCLTELGYLPNGFNPFKSAMVPMDKTIQELAHAYEVVADESPSNIDIALEHAAFELFTRRNAQDARVFLEEIHNVSLAEMNNEQKVIFETLYGIALFEERNSAMAIIHFTKALELDEGNTASRLNLAIALYSAGDIEQAKDHLKKIKDKVTLPHLKKQIETTISM